MDTARKIELLIDLYIKGEIDREDYIRIRKSIEGGKNCKQKAGEQTPARCPIQRRFTE